jgi:uncharacterized membrane protein
MALIIIVAILLVLNMIFVHADKLIDSYNWIYKKLKKPKFNSGEFVLINDVEYEVIYITRNYKPYTYFCLPRNFKCSRSYEHYYHESEIKKKTGLLKELE